MTKTTSGTNTFVYAHWLGMESPVLMGILKATPNRGNLIFSFNYDDKWLKRKDSFFSFDISVGWW